MSNAIVVVNVSETNAPTPSILQQSGAFISQGGTTTAANTLTLLPTLATLTGILAGTKAISTITWLSNVATVTLTANHGWTISDVVNITIAGELPAGYNGTFACTITGATTFTYALLSNPGAQSQAGTAILADENELLQMATTYFAGNGVVSPYVLELGEGTAAEGVTALSAWIAANPGVIYSYLVPREWDAVSSYLTFLATWNTPSSQTYFFTTTTVANRAVYAGLKCVLAEVEAPSIGATEFSLASAFATTLSYNPSPTNRVTPLSYAYAYGVTAYPLTGNATVLAELNTANVGYIGTGAEGGISKTILFYGQMSDGNPFNYWYSADWFVINVNLNLSNEVINGSNNPLAPLYYDQNGINRLQNRAVATGNQAITNGLALGNVIATTLPALQFAANYEAGVYAGQLAINAEPFSVYTTENPSAYATGTYGGLACVYTPLRGFKQILFYLNLTNLLS